MPGDVGARASEPRAPTLGHAAVVPQTCVELIWIERRIERWIRFGRPADELVIDRQRRELMFSPGAVFAFVRWAANDVGTVLSRIDIVQAVAPGGACATVPGIAPGGDILLRLSGWSRVQRALKVIDAVEAVGVDAADVAPDYWRHVHNRLTAGETPRRYSLERHRAWRLRQELTL